MRRLLVPLHLAAVAMAFAEERAVVLKPVLNMYSKATIDADVVSQAIYGTTVRVAAEKNGWARIQTPDEYFGWAETAGLRKLKDGETYAESGRTGMVENLFAHLYREASVTRHQPLLTVPFETRLEVIEEQSGESRWLGVRLPDDRKAWVQRGDMVLESKIRDVPELIELAKRFLGFPYTWGGTSSFGYDCSGFTQMLCRRGGVMIPRDAKPQALWEGMEKIAREDLKPGDLLYFGAALEKVSHTGFYIGNGEFIHSTMNTRPVVQVSRLDDEPWTKLLVATRRWKRQ